MTFERIQKIRDELNAMWEHPANVREAEMVSYIEKVGRTRRKKKGGHSAYQMEGRPTLIMSTHPGAMDKGAVKGTIAILMGDLDYLEAQEAQRLKQSRIN
jgi:hypothetical protein